MREMVFESILDSLTKAKGAMLRWENATIRKRNTLQFGLSFLTSTKFSVLARTVHAQLHRGRYGCLLDRLKEEGVKIDAKRSMNPYVGLPGSMTWMGIRLSSGSRCPESPKGLSAA